MAEFFIRSSLGQFVLNLHLTQRKTNRLFSLQIKGGFYLHCNPPYLFRDNTQLCIHYAHAIR